MQSLRKFLILLLSITLTTSCENPNALTEYSKTDSDEALYLEARKRIDKLDWTGAITILTTSLSLEYQTRSAVLETLLYAYGGKCGISFFNLIDSLKNINSSRIFEISLRLFQGRVVDVAACDSAFSILFRLGANASQRTKNQNLFAAILGITRIGTTLQAKLDTDNGGVGDGIVDAGASFCADSSLANNLSNADINRVASGVGLIFENLSVLNDALTGGSAGPAFANAKGICETTISLPVVGTPASYGMSGGWSSNGFSTDTPTLVDFGLPADIEEPLNCLATRTDEIRPKMRRLFRRMIGSSALGVGAADACDIADIVPSIVRPNGGSEPRLRINIAMSCCPMLDKP